MAEPLLARDELVEELRAAAATAVDRGSGSAFLLTGEAGIGKTSVARFVADAVRGEMVVSWGCCVADGSAPPFWPWQAIVDVDGLGGSGDIGVGAARFARLNELRAQVAALVGSGPMLHVIEDVQWADVSSVLLLSHLANVVHDMPLVLVATLRTGEPIPDQLGEAVEELRRSVRVRPLLPFGADAIAALLEQGGVADDGLVRTLSARTGGVPLYVSELVRAVRAGLDVSTVPARVTEAVEHRLRRLPAPVVGALRAAAVIGTDGEVATVAAVCAADPVTTIGLLDDGRAAGILETAQVGRWRFRHDLVRGAVYDGTSAADRAALHASVLDALARSAPRPVLAHHALAAVPAVAATRAVELAVEAGTQALEHHAYEEGVVWLERALAVASHVDASWRALQLVRIGEARRLVGDAEAGRACFLEAASLVGDDPELLARIALGYADPGADLGIAYRSDDLATAALLERAIAAQPAAMTGTLVRLQARLGAELYFSDEPRRARQLLASARLLADEVHDATTALAVEAVEHDAAVVGQAPLAAQLAGSVALLEAARAIGTPHALLIAHRARIMDALAAGDVALLDAEMLAFRRVAEPLRVPGYRWWSAMWAAMRSLLVGRHDEAEARAVAAFELGAKPFPALAFLNLSFFLFFLRREQGRLSELEQATRDHAAAYADVPAIRAALVFLLAELGRTDDVRSMLAAIDGAALDRLRDRNWPASWFQLARAAWVVGDEALAAVLLRPDRRPSERCVQISLGTACLGSTDLAEAWLRETVGDLDGAAAAYVEAAACNARLGAASWLAQTRVDHARLLLRRGVPGDASEASRLVVLAGEAATVIGLPSVVAAVESLRAVPVAAEPVFRRAGPVWEIQFDGRPAGLPHGRGLADLAVLLARAGEAVSVLELAGERGARGAEALDERARREIRARLRALDDAVDDAEAVGDGERAALAVEERQQLAEAVARDLGLGGRSRRVGDPVERARKTVSTRIRRAIASVAGVHPELGRHLERSVDTGAWCAYRPAEPITWRT